jgi:serine/threonine protein phosphatase PrpC
MKPIISAWQSNDGQHTGDGTPILRNSHAYYYNQEDSYFTLENAPGLAPRDLREIFRNTARQMKEAGDYKYGGTTASVAFIGHDGMLTAAHVGDSPVRVYIQDQNNGNILGSTLVTAPHSPARLDERKRIEARGGTVEFVGGTMRLNRRLALSRAFGDTAQKGITARPEITPLDLNPYFSQGNRVIVTVETDGVMPHANEAARLARFPCNEYADETISGGIAQALGELADELKSHDNITSTVVFMDELPESNIVAAVFDGHGRNAAKASQMAAKLVREQILAFVSRQP